MHRAFDLFGEVKHGGIRNKITEELIMNRNLYMDDMAIINPLSISHM